MAIRYPYLPEGRSIQYVPLSDPYMQAAKDFARAHSLDKHVPTGSVLVKDGKIIGRAANGSNYHESHVCERVRLKIPTGEGYELCEGCHPKNHSEGRAVEDARRNGFDTEGSDLYLWGHWWCCKPCWDSMIAGGVSNVFLLEGSERLLNREHPDYLSVEKRFEQL